MRLAWSLVSRGMCRGPGSMESNWQAPIGMRSGWGRPRFTRPPPSPTLVPSHPRILSACDLDDIHRYHAQHCAWALHTKYLCPPAAVFARQPGLRAFSLSRRPARIYYRIKLFPERHFVLKGQMVRIWKTSFKKVKELHSRRPIHHKRSCGES